MSEQRDVLAVHDWFATRGLGLYFESADGYVWAGLTRLESDAVTVPRYGRGENQAAAAARAQERYQQEQEPPPP